MTSLLWLLLRLHLRHHCDPATSIILIPLLKMMLKIMKMILLVHVLSLQACLAKKVFEGLLFLALGLCCACSSGKEIFKICQKNCYLIFHMLLTSDL